ncbi:MAG TPA: hypothetical protein VEK79_17080 [Thermoanaerobaculia bacterium]|nr:hypothetical protein [Thermoanaerobaculia bacterium]
MRNLIFVAALVLTAHAYAQQSAPPPATTTTSDAPPPLVKTVVVEPTDSPMVRAAKRAVAARVHPSQRRVISLTTTMTRGRIAQGSGTTELPVIPPPSVEPPSPATQREAARRIAAEKAAAEKAAAVQKRLKELEQEEGMLAQEADQQYGDEVDEDLVEKRLAEIEAERKKLLAPPPPPT